MEREEVLCAASSIIFAIHLDNELSSSSSSSESSDEEAEFLFSVLNDGVCSERKVPKVMGYAETVVPRFSPKEFKTHFLMRPTTFAIIENKVSHLIVNKNGVGHHTICPRKQLLMTVWLLANPESFRSVSDRFGVSKSTMWDTWYKVSHALSGLSGEIIKWPTSHQMEISAGEFQKAAGFPGTVGCIDGTHIYISAPLEHPDAYVNRNKRHSLILQGVCNENMLFIDCYAGEAGSLHDARVFRRSFLGRELETLISNQNYHLLGDSAYPLKLNLMKPFRDNGHLTRQQNNYNFRLSQIRNKIERAFGLLKGRFRRLKYLHVNRTLLAPMTIMACCVLHNFCQQQHDEVPIDEEEESVDDVELEEREEVSSTEKRNEIMASLP